VGFTQGLKHALDGVHIHKEKGRFWEGVSDPLVLMAFLSSFVREKYIGLVQEKFITFPFGQHNNGNVVYLSL